MKEVAPGVFQLKGFPPNAINVWLMGDVLVDASTKLAGRRSFRQLEGRDVTAHALTHAHADHQGASHEICEKLGIPFWVGENDVEPAESGDVVSRQPKHPMNTLVGKMWPGPGHPVARHLHEGDDV